MNLLKLAVDGLSIEVRAISNHLHQRGKEGSSSQGAAAAPSKAAKGGPLSSGKKQPKDGAADRADDEEYAADSEEAEKLTLPARARSPAHNQLAVSAPFLYWLDADPSRSRLMYKLIR